MEKLKNQIRDYVLSRGAYVSCRLSVDYEIELTKQSNFGVFNQLFRQIKMVYRRGEADDELHQLSTVFVNSLFWDYAPYEKLGAVGEQILEDMLDRMYVEQTMYRHLTSIANHYRVRRQYYSPEKVVLMQSLASLSDFYQTSGFPYFYSLVPFMLMNELCNWVDDIRKFESEAQRLEDGVATKDVRRKIEQTLRFLSKPQLDGYIIKAREYERLVDEIEELLREGRLPSEIVALEITAKGTLGSGYSWMFVSYGISLLYRKNRLPRELWIEYLSVKILKSKAILQKKFATRPTSWSEKIIEE